MKKTFKDLNPEELNSPAMAFISPASQVIEEKPAEPKETKAKAIMPAKKPSKDKKEEIKETKSKRLNLLIKPSNLEDFNKVAFMERTSMNDLINVMIKNYCDAHRDEIEAYNKYFNKGE